LNNLSQEKKCLSHIRFITPLIFKRTLKMHWLQ
jgi:hypothetical protein